MLMFCVCEIPFLAMSGYHENDLGFTGVTQISDSIRTSPLVLPDRENMVQPLE